MKNRTSLLALLLVLLPTFVAGAEKLSFLSETAVDPVRLLPGPPLLGSEEAKAELDCMVAIQETRTQVQVARCCSEVRVTLAAFRDVMGPWFTAENLPKLNRLVQRADKDTKYFTDAVKSHYDRKRPYDEDNRIHPATELERTPAYPSGHATRGIVFAKILIKLAPDRRAALLERGREIGWDRVLAGMHHPSDIIAGRVLGQAIAQALMENPSFEQELAEAKAEFDAVRLQQTAPVGAGAGGK